MLGEGEVCGNVIWKLQKCYDGVEGGDVDIHVKRLKGLYRKSLSQQYGASPAIWDRTCYLPSDPGERASP